METTRRPRWVTFLAVIGALTIVSVIVSLFFSLGRRPSQLHEAEAPAVLDPDFIAVVAGTAGSPVLEGGTVKLLMDGDQFFPRLDAALRGARSTIDFAVYIWEPGVVCDQVVAALVDRARAGVQVRVLLDGLGGMKAPEEKMEELKAAGVKIEKFRAPRFGKLTRFHRRNHRRAIVIDGRIAFTGGMAVGDKWLGHAQAPENWRDSMVEVTGPLASSVQSAFVATWAHTTGEMLAGPLFFPPPPPPDGGAPATAVPGATEPAPAAGGQHVLRHMFIASSPSSEDHPLRLLFMQSFVSARKTLHITTPYFIPDESLRKALIDRARAGVDVRIISNSDHTDAKPIRSASHSYFEELLEGGVRIYEYQATMIHTKHLVVDGQWSVVGSPNMDVRSKELNQENVLGILDPGLASELEKVFQEDLAKSKEIKLEEWRERGVMAKAGEKLATLFEEQY